MTPKKTLEFLKARGLDQEKRPAPISNYVKTETGIPHDKNLYHKACATVANASWDTYDDTGLVRATADDSIRAFVRCAKPVPEEDYPACLALAVNGSEPRATILFSSCYARYRPAVLGFVSDREVVIDQNGSVAMYDAISGKQEWEVPGAWQSAISPDKRYVAYLSHFSTQGGVNLWLIDLAMKRKTNLSKTTNHGFDGYGSIEWTQKGGRILFELGDLKPYEASVDGSSARKLCASSWPVSGS